MWSAQRTEIRTENPAALATMRKRALLRFSVWPWQQPGGSGSRVAEFSAVWAYTPRYEQAAYLVGFPDEFSLNGGQHVEVLAHRVESVLDRKSRLVHCVLLSKRSEVLLATGTVLSTQCRLP